MTNWILRMSFTARTGGRLALAAALAVYAFPEQLLAQSESLPQVDPAVPKLEAGTPKVGAQFGFTMAAGKLRVTSGDTRDDLVVCAVGEDNGSLDQVGAAYIFEDETLDAPATNFRLLPTPQGTTGLLPLMNLGVRAVAIANLRGNDEFEEPRDNLILIGCPGHQAEYEECDPVGDSGSVELYDYNAAGIGSVPQQSLFPPLNPDPDGCPDATPNEVNLFGHGLAVGDVSRDGIPDLIVGALRTLGPKPGTTTQETSPRGRIYIFLGHGDDSGEPPPENDFYDEPWQAWVGINAPEAADPDVDWGEFFGTYVATAHVSGDSAADVIVGRPDRERAATPCNPQPPTNPDECPPQGGSAYVFRGAYLHDLFQGDPYDPDTEEGTWNVVIDPPHPDPDLVGYPGGLDQYVPEYQVLRNPFGDIQPDGSGRYELWVDWFGYFVFNGGDCGSPEESESEGDFDMIDDILIHGETSDFIGTQTVGNPQVPNVGSLILYHGLGGEGDPFIVDPTPVLLQRPINVASGIPNEGSRIGRHFARADGWYNCLTDEVEPALFISEPDSDWNSVTDAGIVNLIRLPLPSPSSPTDPWWVPRPIVNAWGTSPLTEPQSSDPTENGPAHTFGGWIVTLDYKGNQASFPGTQVVISAREAPVRVSAGTHGLLPHAGRAFPFLPPSEPCEAP